MFLIITLSSNIEGETWDIGKIQRDTKTWVFSASLLRQVIKQYQPINQSIKQMKMNALFCLFFVYNQVSNATQ